MTERIAHPTGMFLPKLVNENTYEGVIRSLSTHLFPGYVWCDFKSEIRHPDGLVHADAALVASDYSRWYVVEVELGWHRWETHIRPQLEKLSKGIFRSRHRDRLLRNQPSLTHSGLEELDIYNPELLLIIDHASPMVRNWCRSRGILCLEAALFWSHAGEVVLAVAGDELRKLEQTEPRLVGRAVRAQYVVEVAMLLYDFPSELSDREEVFEVEIGETRVGARNFGTKPRGLALQCRSDEFEQLVGNSRRFSFFRLGPNLYKLQAGD